MGSLEHDKTPPKPPVGVTSKPHLGLVVPMPTFPLRIYTKAFAIRCCDRKGIS